MQSIDINVQHIGQAAVGGHTHKLLQVSAILQAVLDLKHDILSHCSVYCW